MANPANKLGLSEKRARQAQEAKSLRQRIKNVEVLFHKQLHDVMIAHTTDIAGLQDEARNNGVHESAIQYLFSGPAGMTSKIVHDASVNYLDTFIPQGNSHAETAQHGVEDSSSDAETILHSPSRVVGDLDNESGSQDTHSMPVNSGDEMDVDADDSEYNPVIFQPFSDDLDDSDYTMGDEPHGSGDEDTQVPTLNKETL